MTVFSPLRRRPIAFLWCGQVLSNIGDEIYGVALVWMAAGLIGTNTGYLTAVQAASIFVVGILGGMWAEHWSHGRTMIVVDVLRGIAVILLPLVYLASGQVPLWLLIPVAMVVASLSAFFTPALTASLPILARGEGSLLRATNGLMGTTPRLARIVGPGLVGFLGGVVPTIHFFTLDALSFFCSALSIMTIRDAIRQVPRPRSRTTLRETLGPLRDSDLLRFILLSSGVVATAWFMVLPLGMALLVHERTPQHLGALGWLVSAYGIGNLTSNVVLGSLVIRDPKRVIFGGRLVAGSGFVGLALAPSFPWMLAASCLAAVGGPMTDLAFLAILQAGHMDIARVYRLAMSIDYGCLVLGLVVSPMLFRTFGIAPTIGLCGLSMVAVALLGFVRFWERGS